MYRVNLFLHLVPILLPILHIGLTGSQAFFYWLFFLPGLQQCYCKLILIFDEIFHYIWWDIFIICWKIQTRNIPVLHIVNNKFKRKQILLKPCISDDASTVSYVFQWIFCPITLLEKESKLPWYNMKRKVEENVILHEIFRLVSRFPRYISCSIAESRLPLGQCIPTTVHAMQQDIYK